MEGGTYGELTSTIPAITVPAWASMLSSKDPGQLGFYGFRNRADHSYERMTIATSRSVKADRVWDILSRAGKKVVVAGVPQTYPGQAGQRLHDLQLSDAQHPQPVHLPGSTQARDRRAWWVANTCSTCPSSAPRTRTTCWSRSTSWPISTTSWSST